MSSLSFPVLCGLCRALTDLTETITIHRSEIPNDATCQFTFDGDRVQYTKKTIKRFSIPRWKYVTDEANPNRVIGVIDPQAGVEICSIESFEPYIVTSACVHICPSCQNKPVVILCKTKRASLPP